MTEKAIALPFSFDSSGQVSYTTDLRKIWQDRVVSAVMTSLGDRVMRPTWGSSIQGALFTSVDTAMSEIKNNVSFVFSQWLPSLTLLDTTGTVDPSDGTLVITISYQFGSVKDPQNVQIRTTVFSRSGDTLLEVPNV